jgi:hypothetical protein
MVHISAIERGIPTSKCGSFFIEDRFVSDPARVTCTACKELIEAERSNPVATIGSIHAEQHARESLTRTVADLRRSIIAELRQNIADLEGWYKGEIQERDLRILSLEAQLGIDKPAAAVTDRDLSERGKFLRGGRA